MSLCRLILILTVLNLSHEMNNLNKTLVFVFDVSTSMSNELDLLSNESMMLLDNLNKWSSHAIDNYILVQFGNKVNRHEICKFVSTTKYLEMKNELNELKITGSDEVGSFMASCYPGFLSDLHLAHKNSIFLVFTDAGTKYKELLKVITKFVQQKRISFYITLIKESTRTIPEDVVTIYNGEVYNVDYTSISKHFKLLTQILTGPPLAPSVEVFVDSTMSEFILTVTGLNAIITIFDPNEKYVSSTRYKMLTDLPTVKMLKLPDPIPGRYTIEINSEKPYTGQVQTKSELQFEYGFAIQEPNSIMQTEYAPLEGYKTYLAISPSNASLIENLEYIILSSTTDYKHELHKKTTKNGELFVTAPFLIPSEPFRIYVHGRDRLAYPIIRLISPAIKAIPAIPLQIVGNKNITIQEEDQILLTCQVNLNVNVTITWLKGGLNNKQTFLVSKQSGQLNYTIDKSQSSDSGEYICIAENSVEKIESKSFVTVKRTHRLTVYTPIKLLNTTVGTEKIELECQISHLLIFATVSWLFNGTTELPKGSQYILPNLVLSDIDPSFSGTYTCIGQHGNEIKSDYIKLNVMYPPKIINLFNIKTYTVIDTTKPLKIVDKNEVQINCVFDGNPTPTVYWINRIGGIVSNTANVTINRHIANQSDEFSCYVENHLGTYKRKIIILITAEPFELENPLYDIQVATSKPTCMAKTQLDDNEHYTCLDGDFYGSINKTLQTNTMKPYDIFLEISTDKQLIVNDRFEMKCSAKGVAPRELYWLKNKIFFKIGGSIIFEKIQSHNNGKYTCVASNHLGTIKITKILKIFSPPKFASLTDFHRATNQNNAKKLSTSLVLKFIPVHRYYFEADFEKTIVVNEKEPIILNCVMFGDPPPQIKWFKNNVELKITNRTILAYKRASLKHSGIYKCIGSNDIGQTKAIFYVNVKKPVFITSLTRISSTKMYNPNEKIKLTCKVKGNPLPTIRIHSANFSTGTDFIFDQAVNRQTLLFQNNTKFYFDGNQIIDEKRAAFLERYSILTYKEYIGIFTYIIRSVQAKDAGLHKCTARQSSIEVHKSITIKLSEPIDNSHVDQVDPRKQIIKIHAEDFPKIAQMKPSILTPITHLKFDLYNKLILECRATGNPPPTIKWYKYHNSLYQDIKTIGEFQQINGTLIKDRIQISDESKYLCVATNEIGSSSKVFEVILSRTKQSET